MWPPVADREKIIMRETLLPCHFCPIWKVSDGRDFVNDDLPARDRPFRCLTFQRTMMSDFTKNQRKKVLEEAIG